MASGGSVACTQEGGDCACVKAEPARPVRRAPAAPGTGPVARKLAAGESAWLCSCGESKNYPFCDGSHRAYNAANGTTFAPFPFKNEKAEEAVTYFCACGKSKKASGCCDGSHAK